ncbi:MAG: hypothetical protein HYV61_02625 [Candidatus Rokubacteria bacterium]|nr:hypothetical protein [Candidatus Rokubacteria bacterium]
MPAAVVATTAFRELAAQAARALGTGALPLLVIEHPLGGEPPERVQGKAEEALRHLEATLQG